MNEIVKFLLAGDIFMFEMRLRQPAAFEKSGFRYSASRPLTKGKEKIQNFKETGHSRDIYQNELDKGCFEHDIAYRDFEDLTRRTASDKILRDKAFNIAKSPKYEGYQHGLASMVYKVFDKKTFARCARSENLATRATQVTRNKFAGSGIKNGNISKKELAEELHKLIIRKCKKRKLYSYCRQYSGCWYSRFAIDK